MTVNENDFFRKATLRICGSLEIERALWDCFMYIRDYIPADIILYNVYDPGVGIGEIIAKADVSGGELTSIKTIFPADTRQLIEEMRKNPQMMPRVLIADRISDHPIMGPMSKIIGHPDAAFMAIGPKPEWNLFGGIFVGNNAGEKYTEKHVRLFTLLNEPFAIALSNYMRYREVLRLKEILADDNRYLQDELRRQAGDEIVGASFGLKQVMEMVSQVAPLTSPVLLLGKRGREKRSSQRPFIIFHPAETVLLSRSISVPFRSPSWIASFLAMRKGRLQGPFSRNGAVSSGPRAARSFSMKSAS